MWKGWSSRWRELALLPFAGQSSLIIGQPHLSALFVAGGGTAMLWNEHQVFDYILLFCRLTVMVQKRAAKLRFEVVPCKDERTRRRQAVDFIVVEEKDNQIRKLKIDFVVVGKNETMPENLAQEILTHGLPCMTSHFLVDWIVSNKEVNFVCPPPSALFFPVNRCCRRNSNF